MKEIMFKKIFSKELIVGIIINLFIVSTAQLVFIIVFNAFFDDWKTPLSQNIWLVYLFIVLIIYILKFSLLPLYLSIIEKYSKNLSVITFLSNLKTNAKMQNKFLYYGFLIDIIICVIFVLFVHPFYSFLEFLSSVLFWFLIYIITGAGLLGSYLALFYGQEPKKD